MKVSELIKQLPIQGGEDLEVLVLDGAAGATAPILSIEFDASEGEFLLEIGEFESC